MDTMSRGEMQSLFLKTDSIPRIDIGESTEYHPILIKLDLVRYNLVKGVKGSESRNFICSSDEEHSHSETHTRKVMNTANPTSAFNDTSTPEPSP